MTAAKDTDTFGVTRGRSFTRSHHHVKRCHTHIYPTVSCGSYSTTDTIPRSLSPSSRTSIYAANLQTAHKRRLKSPFLGTEGLSEYPEDRCFVTSMPYTNSKLGISGYYSGEMDVVSKLPDGEGMLCCHDGRVLDGEWRIGEFQAFCPILARRPRASDSSFPGDSSICSSLSASVTRHAWRHLDETKKIKIPKNLYIVKYPVDYVNTGDSSIPRSPPARMGSRGSASDQTEKTSPLSRMDSIDNGKLDNESKKALKPSRFVSKINMSMNTIRRRM
ncbi:hypothetical protein HJC23_007868 [Cyclotella cryptica]|uniref:Uncharacterized protein n=1 Tax=Cyclotella cryptica TaxID=29204 RepID=A0ABD3R072_9STRA